MYQKIKNIKFKYIFQPKIIETLRDYSKAQLTKDVMAGIIVGIIAFPLAVAFGIASGVTPEKGLYTAIIAGFIISLLGGSRVQIGGPTGAFIVIVYGIVQQYGVIGLAIATIIAGVMLVTMGLLKLGVIIKFIPYPIVVGFTSGIAVTIFATQINDLLGLSIDNLPADFISKWIVYLQHITSIDGWTFAIGIASILIIVLTPRFFKKIPGSLLAIILITGLVYLLKTVWGIENIETIGDKFSIRASLPELAVPDITFDTIRQLLPSAFTIAILGAIESLLSATVADGVVGDRHNSNTELIAQGAANIIAPIFGGIPATGAIARTMANINNGGKTPIAGIVHAITLLLILLFLGSLTKYIPLACLAGVLVVVAYNMSEWRTFKSMLQQSKSDVTVLLATFFLTVIFDLTIAIEVGLLLAAMLFIRRVTSITGVSVFSSKLGKDNSDTHMDENMEDESDVQLPEGIEVFEIEGPFFFGVANKFDEVMKRIKNKSDVRIIKMRNVPFIDATGINNLENLIKTSQKNGIKILLIGVNKKVRQEINKSNIISLIGETNIFSTIEEALSYGKVYMKEKNKVD